MNYAEGNPLAEMKIEVIDKINIVNNHGAACPDGVKRTGRRIP